MFSSLIDSATQLFTGEPAAGPAQAPANDVGASATMASGFPSLSSVVDLFGGLFGGNDKAPEQPDPAVLARQDADAKLKAMLEVDGAGQNGVTKEQYDQMVQLYADIGLGRTDIQFDTKGMDPKQAAELKQLALGDMAKMMQTESGRAMLAGLAANQNDKGEHKTTTLQFIDDPEDSSCTRVDSTDPMERQELWNNDHTKGVGNNAIVRYVPGKSFLQTGPDGYEVQQTGDTILFHEMAHAHHRTHGTLAGDYAPAPMDVHDGKVDADEFQATGLGKWAAEPLSENQYREERAQLGDDIGLRPRYNPDNPDKQQHHHHH